MCVFLVRWSQDKNRNLHQIELNWPEQSSITNDSPLKTLGINIILLGFHHEQWLKLIMTKGILRKQKEFVSRPYSLAPNSFCLIGVPFVIIYNRAAWKTSQNVVCFAAWHLFLQLRTFLYFFFQKRWKEESGLPKRLNKQSPRTRWDRENTSKQQHVETFNRCLWKLQLWVLKNNPSEAAGASRLTAGIIPSKYISGCYTFLCLHIFSPGKQLRKRCSNYLFVFDQTKLFTNEVSNRDSSLCLSSSASRLHGRLHVLSGCDYTRSWFSLLPGIPSAHPAAVYFCNSLLRAVTYCSHWHKYFTQFLNERSSISERVASHEEQCIVLSLNTKYFGCTERAVRVFWPTSPHHPHPFALVWKGCFAVDRGLRSSQ